MAFNIGINVIETNGTASPAIVGAPTSVAGLVLRTRRGPIDGDPIRVSDIRQFAARFGGFDPRFIGAYCVDGFFRNGGREAYIARVLGSNSTAASVVLDNRNGEPTLTVTAGYRGTSDHGEWGNDLFIDIVPNPEVEAQIIGNIAGNSPARLLGEPLPSRVNLSPLPGNITRSLILQRGTDSFPVSFGQLPLPENSTIQDIIDVINTQAGERILATVQGGGILLTSTVKGEGPAIAIADSTYEAPLNRLGFTEDIRESQPAIAAQPAELLGEPISAIGTIDLVGLTLVLSVSDADPIRIPLPDQATSEGFIDLINSQEGIAEVISVELVSEPDNAAQVRIRLTSVTTGEDITINIDIVDASDLTNEDALTGLGFPAPNRISSSGSDAIPATLVGADLNEAIDLRDSNGVLALQIDGSPSLLVIDLTSLSTAAGPVSAQDVVDSINSQADDVLTATVEGSSIQLASPSSFTMIGDDTPVLLGFVDAEGNTISGDLGTDAAENPESLIIQVDPDLIDEFQVGQWVCLDDAITQDCFQIESIDSVENTITVSIPDNAPPLNEYREIDGATLSTVEFDLLVRQLSPTDPAPLLVETWESLTLDPLQTNYVVSQINDPDSGSTHIMLENFNNPANDISQPFSGNQTPAAGQAFRLGRNVDGSDGEEPSTDDYRTAFNRFDSIAIQLLSVLATIPTEPMLRAITRAALDYCEDKGDCMFVGHTPNVEAAGAKAFGRKLRASKVYGALYWPWITITDPVGTGANPVREVPPTGHILGMYARIDQTRGVWKAPAGNEARLRGALTVKYSITDVDHTDLVKNGSVNGVRSLPGAGVVVDASRTLSTDTRWLYINVRLLFNYVKASLREGLRWVKQEPNRETLWNKIKYNAVIPFLQGLYQEGGFGPGTPDQVFTVICGPENNSPAQIQLGELNIEVYFYPARPAETIIITIGQQDSGASASES